MIKVFSALGGLVLLAVAAVHGYRLYSSFAVVVGTRYIPLWYSWPGAVIAAFLGVMVLLQSRR